MKNNLIHLQDDEVKVTLTEDNYVDLLAKLLRANYEESEIAKVIKSLYGYGHNGYPIDRYTSFDCIF